MSAHQGAGLSKETQDRCSSRLQGGSLGPRISLYENILAISRTPFGSRKHLFPRVALGGGGSNPGPRACWACALLLSYVLALDRGGSFARSSRHFTSCACVPTNGLFIPRTSPTLCVHIESEAIMFLPSDGERRCREEASAVRNLPECLASGFIYVSTIN